MKDDARKKLAEMIGDKLKADFAEIYLSGNLRETIQIKRVGEDYKIIIPAVRYDIQKFREEEAIVHQPEKGSYAQAVNLSGGFSKKHKNYVEKSIEKAITEWLGWLGVKATSVKTM